MKHRLINTIVGGIVLLSFFGCQEDDSVFNNGNKGIKIQPELQIETTNGSTRTVAGNGAAFANGDIIGVSIAKGDNTTPNVGDVNYPYTYTQADNKWAPGKNMYWVDDAEGTAHTLYAYYPYDEKTYATGTGVTSADFEMALTAAGDIDMTAEGAYAAADKIWGSKTGVTPTTEAVTVPMKHQMGQIVITLKAGEGVTDAEVKAMTVELLPTAAAFTTTGTFDILTGKVSAAVKQTSEPAKLQMLKVEDTFYALLIPGQNFTVGKPFARIKTDSDDKSYIYNLTLIEGETLTATAGKSVKFALTVAKAGVSGMNVTAAAWDEPNGNYQSGMEVEESLPIRVEGEWLYISTTAGNVMDLLTNNLPDEFTTNNIKKLHIMSDLNVADLGHDTDPNNPIISGKLKNFIQEKGITDLYIKGDVTENVYSAFEACSTLENVEWDVLSGAGNTIVDRLQRVFANSGVKKVIVRNVPTVPQGAFVDCNSLETAVFPSATTIRRNSFACNKITNLVVADLKTLANTALDKNGYPTNVFLTNVKVSDGYSLKENYKSVANTGGSPDPITYDFSGCNIYSDYDATGSDGSITHYTNASNYNHNSNEEKPADPTQTADERWIAGLTQVTDVVTGGLESKLNSLSTDKTRLYIKGKINATDFANLVAFIKTNSVKDLCLDVEGNVNTHFGDDVQNRGKLPTAPTEDYKFEDCASLENIWLLSVTKVSTATSGFWECTGLKTIYMPKLTEIANQFLGQDGRGGTSAKSQLTTVVLPNVGFGNQAGYGCFQATTALKTVVLKGSLPVFAGSNIFFNNRTNLTLYVIEPVSGATSSDGLNATYGNMASGKFTTISGEFNGIASYEDYLKADNYTYHYPAK